MRINNTLKILFKIVFLILTLILSFAYFILVKEKILKPNFKNLPTNEIVILGLIILTLFFLNLKYVFGLFKNKMNNENK
jgi:hypothetical protein